MTQINYDLLMYTLALFALFSSLFVITTIQHQQALFVQIVRLFISFGLFALHLDLLNRF